MVALCQVINCKNKKSHIDTLKNIVKQWVLQNYDGQAAAQQNVQYVYTQPQAGAPPSAQPQQQVIIMPTDSVIARDAQKEEIRQYQQNHGQRGHHGYHQPNHRPPTDPKEPSYKYDDGTDAEVHVVKWENFRLPIPQNHAKFMRKVWTTLVLQLIFTAGTISKMCPLCNQSLSLIHFF